MSVKVKTWYQCLKKGNLFLSIKKFLFVYLSKQFYDFKNFAKSLSFNLFLTFAKKN